MSNEQEVQQIDKQLLVARLVDMPGTIIFLMAVYARFYTEGDAFIAILNNNRIVDGMFVMGAGLMVMGGIKIYKLKRKRSRLIQNLS